MRQRRRFLSFCFSDRSFSLLLISPVSTHTHTTGWLPAPIPIAISTSLKLEASWPASRAKSRQPRPDEKNRITRPSSFPISWNRFSGYYYYFLLLKKKGLPRPRKRRNPVRRDKKNATQSGTEGPVVAVANVDCFDFYCLFFFVSFFLWVRAHSQNDGGFSRCVRRAQQLGAVWPALATDDQCSS